MQYKLSIGCFGFASFWFIQVLKYKILFDRNLNFHTPKSFAKITKNNLESTFYKNYQNFWVIIFEKSRTKFETKSKH